MKTEIIDFINAQHGVDVSKFDESFLYKSLQKRIAEINCYSTEEYYSILEKNTKEGSQFIDSLHISYSEFFRNPLTFSVLEKIILPSIIHRKENNKRKEIRIWSAACAIGQEAYSIAMLLEEIKGTDNEKFCYRIFATDQSEEQVNKAYKGEYTANLMNNINLKRLKRWFTKEGKIYTVNSELKENIDFSVFDLFNEHLSSPPVSIFGGFDMIFCANLLFYYKPEHRKVIIQKISNSLTDKSFLVTGEAERDIFINNKFNEVYPQSAIFQISK
ncbi:MAG: protein-glutamate O-methyltransferase CheR [Bacteroidetes bacterium]|nr:protein-glutamate O-methyltransferase CheR [Bacteroidota bacterium]